MAFVGQLKQNGVLSSLYNMIIGQEVFSDNIELKGTLFEKFRVDGTLYGDTKLFISTDVGKVRDFPDASGTLLTKRTADNPFVQDVTIDTFKQAAITVDTVKLKQAFQTADVYGAFVAVSVNWLRDAYKVLNITLINTYVGTTVSAAVSGEIDVELPAEPETSIVEKQAYNSFLAELIGEKIADVSVDLEDALRDYNDLGYLRSYSLEKFILVWNKRWANKIKHVSLPKIFHKDEVIGKELESITINSRYFGTPIAAAVANGTTNRTLEDIIVKVNPLTGVYSATGAERQFFAGDILPKDTPSGTVPMYVEDATIICKLVHKKSIPFMSALLVGTEFYNPKDLDRNHYLTWGYSKPQYLKEFPLLTFKADVAEVVAP